jgi:tetratricopeptide (TPR) repeat protein
MVRFPARRRTTTWGFGIWILGVGICLPSACQRAPAPEAVVGSSDPSRAVTFNKDVAPILFQHCATCHRPIESDIAGRAAPATSAGRATSGANPRTENVERVPPKADPPSDPLCVAGAPFSVLDYASASRHAHRIATATQKRAMPPWLPEPGHGAFINERRLRDDQIAVIQRWVEQGAREGDAADRPQPPTWPSGWQLGTPDLVLRSEDAYTLQPGDRDVFRNFVMPVPRASARPAGSGPARSTRSGHVVSEAEASTRYVRAIEFRADNPRVLHHANVALDPARVSRKLDRADPGPGFATMPEDQVQNVFGWSPGKLPILEPADTAWALEEGSDLVVQLHMISSGKPETVQPTIGLFFTSTPPTRVPIVVKLESKAIDIPAGEANHVVEDSYVLPVDVEAVSIYPHAHYLAKDMRGTATLPDGTEKPLIWIRQWDVRWQDQYRYQTPVFLPKGTTLKMRFTYDNSEANRNNRHHPPRRVRWGPLSTDEMGALWLEVIPRRHGDTGILTQDYYRRAVQTDIAAAEMRIRANPDDPAAHNLLAMKYVQAGRAQEAQARLEQALRLKPDDAEAHSNLGTVLQLQGRLADATAHLREAARLKPGDDRVRFNLGNGMHAAGRIDDAIREYRLAIRINPDNGDAHFNLAMLLGPQNRLDEAIAHLQRVVEINPRNGDAYRNLAVALGLQGRIDEAILQARTALRIQPDSLAAQQQLDLLLAALARR